MPNPTSIRFNDDETARIQALAAVLGVTSVQVVKDGVAEYITRTVASPQYEEALEEYRRRRDEPIAALEAFRASVSSGSETEGSHADR